MRSRRFALVLALGMLVSCTSGDGGAVAAPEHAGCRERTRAGTCLWSEGEPLVLLTPKSLRIRWQNVGGRLDVQALPDLADASRVSLSPSHAVRRLEGVDAEGRVRYALAVAPLRSPAFLQQAQARKDAGEFAAARALLAEPRALTPDEELHVRWLEAHTHLAAGELDQARERLARTIELGARSATPSVAVDAAITLAYLEAHLAHAPERADEALRTARRHVQDDGDRHAQLAYCEGLSARERGDLRTALARFEEASRLAERFDEASLYTYVQGARAKALTLLGRPLEALAIERELLARGSRETSCRLADLTASVGFTALLAMAEVGVAAAGELRDEAHERLEESRGHAERCGDPVTRANAHVNLALLALNERDFLRARLELELGRVASTAYTATWEREVEGRVLSSEGRHEAAAQAFQRELALSRAAGDQDGIWRSLVSLGRTQLVMREYEAASRSFAEAERTLDRLSLSVPLGIGRGLFLDRREASAEGLIDALLGAGQVHEAHLAARVALSREEALSSASLLPRADAEGRAAVEALLRSYRAARDRLTRSAEHDWELSDSELARVEASRKLEVDAAHKLLDQALALSMGPRPAFHGPAEGTLQLSFVPHGTDLLAFAETRRGARVERIARTASDGAALLAPFAAEIERAEAIELRAAGALEALDLHALELDGRPLFSFAKLSYALDGAELAEAHLDPRALVVLDPTHALPHARAEGALVARVLGMRSEVAILQGAEASREAVLDGLGHASFVHFAGHGQRGTAPLEPRLELAGGALSLADVLGLSRAPERVVLSACEAGVSPEPTTLARTLGLAQAFVSRGAREVVAPVRKVDDAATERLVGALYAAYERGGDLRQALRSAQITLSGESDESWKSFRVWTR